MNGIRVLIIIMFLLLLVVLVKFRTKEVHYVESDIDGRKYLVRDVPDKQKAANMLARIRKNIMILTDHLIRNKDGDFKPYIEQLEGKIFDVVISESGENSVYTSYSVNKGEQIVFCLRSKLVRNSIHDLNLIMYVVLHELGHVACPEYGHTDLFKRIFAYFTQVAIDIGLYDKIDFSENPVEYCGLEITESIV